MNMEKKTEPRYVINVPGMKKDREMGLGDAVEKITHRIGVEPCSPCKCRRDNMNLLMAFRGRR